MITFEVARQWNHSGLADAIERLVLPGPARRHIYDICQTLYLPCTIHHAENDN